MSDSSLLRASRELFVSVLAGGAVDAGARGVDRFTALLEEESVAAGRRIFAAGEAIEQVYFMRHGRVRLERAGAPPWTIEGSAAFGAFEVVLGRPHGRSGVALVDLMLMRLPAESWLALLDDDFDLARSVIVEGLRRVADLEARVWAVWPEARRELRPRVLPSRGRGPLDFVDRVRLLASVPMLRAAGVQVLADLAGALEEWTFDAGAIVHRRGAACGHALIVVDGEILGHRRAPCGPDVSVAFGPGSVVCGASWLGDAQLAWETRAATRSRVLALDAERWLDTMEEHVALLHATLGAITIARETLLEQLASMHGALTVAS
jgi:CRP-like cAMP-binding protein